MERLNIAESVSCLPKICPTMFLKTFRKRRLGAIWGGGWEPDHLHAQIIAGSPPGRRYFQPLGGRMARDALTIGQCMVESALQNMFTHTI